MDRSSLFDINDPAYNAEQIVKLPPQIAATAAAKTSCADIMITVCSRTSPLNDYSSSKTGGVRSFSH